MIITSRASDYSSFVSVHHRNSKIYTPHHILSGLPKYRQPTINELVVDMELGSAEDLDGSKWTYVRTVSMWY